MVERGNSFLVGIMYRPPKTSKHLYKKFEQKLANIVSNILLLKRETIILGDLNAIILTTRTMYKLKIFSNYAAVNKSLKLQQGSQKTHQLVLM